LEASGIDKKILYRKFTSLPQSKWNGTLFLKYL
jgi:hypothetical protein